MIGITEILEKSLLPHGVDRFGYCAFSDILPLLPCRAASRLPGKPKTVIACLFPYYTGDYPERNVARFAIVNDYHAVAGHILESAVNELSSTFPAEEFSAFTDDSPIREKEAARLCGLGGIGLNKLLISPKYGSYVFIGCIVTSMYIQPAEKPGGGCADCGRCARACPTSAIKTGGKFDASLCLSRITQNKEALSEWEVEQVRGAGFVWGCDICQSVCTHNAAPKNTPIQAFYQNIAPVLTVDNLDEIYPLKAYNYRKKEILLRNIELMETRGEQYGNSHL